MKPRVLASIVAGLAFVVACGDAPTGPAPDFRVAQGTGGGRGVHRVTVMTQNLYVGADVDAVIAALLSPDPNDDVGALVAAVETLGKTDFPTRAGGFVDAIERERPHVVGLQEVSHIMIDLTGFGQPVLIDLEFLPILEAQLAARGLPYVVADTIKNIDARPVPWIRLVDYDAVLVDTSRATIDFTYAQNFSNNVGPIAPGVELKRGLVEVAATIAGRRYFFVSAHLEPDLNAETDLSGLRQAQAWELAVAVLGDSTPAFVMGDLNDVPGSPMYNVFRQAGFEDVWHELRPGVSGYTTPRPPDLANPKDEFTRRLDYVWARGVEHGEAGLLGQVELIGVRPWERVEGPAGKIWPSDHAGLVASLFTTPERGYVAAGYGERW